MLDVTIEYQDFKELYALHPELTHELRSIALERKLRDSTLEVLRLTDLTEALLEPTPDVDPDEDKASPE